VKIEGGLYFANVRSTIARLLDLVDAARPRPSVVLLDLSAVPDVDMTALHAAAELRRSLAERGIALWIACTLERPLEMIRRLGVAPEGSVFPDVATAVEAFVAGRRPEVVRA
jgi:sulfate permease, SulP family